MLDWSIVRHPMVKAISNIEALKSQVAEAMQKCLVFFPGVDRTQIGYEGLMAAQECLPNNAVRDNFAAAISYMSNLWEAISPDSMLDQYRVDYRWLVQVYDSVKPTSGTGKLIWHTLGAKTIEMIHQNVHVQALHDDLDILVLDAELLEAVIKADPKKKSKEIEIKLTARLRKHAGNPKFKQLSDRLESLRERHEQGLMHSIDFLKQLLELAKEVVQAEREIPPAFDGDKAKSALTDLFKQAKNEKTPIVVERIVADIDEIVRVVRFPGWQKTSAGEREVKKSIRKTLLKYQLHSDQILFDKCYGYVLEYY